MKYQPYVVQTKNNCRPIALLTETIFIYWNILLTLFFYVFTHHITSPSPQCFRVRLHSKQSSNFSESQKTNTIPTLPNAKKEPESPKSDGKGNNNISRPAKHARGTSQPNCNTATLKTSLSCHRIAFIRLPASRTPPISVVNRLVAEETEFKPARAWEETRIRRVQVFVADGTRRGCRSSAETLVQLRKTNLLGKIG